MDTRKRTILKALTWQTSGLIMTALIGFLFTGSMTAAGGLAVAGTATGTVTYVIHERLWASVRWGRAQEREVPAPKPF